MKSGYDHGQSHASLRAETETVGQIERLALAQAPSGRNETAWPVVLCLPSSRVFGFCLIQEELKGVAEALCKKSNKRQEILPEGNVAAIRARFRALFQRREIRLRRSTVSLAVNFALGKKVEPGFQSYPQSAPFIRLLNSD